jgi:hypothetical protein
MCVHGHPGRRKSTELQDLRDVQRASVGDSSRKYSAIWVLLIRRRMLCSSRWVIPGLAEGVTGWLASRRQPVFGRPSASGEK